MVDRIGETPVAHETVFFNESQSTDDKPSAAILKHGTGLNPAGHSPFEHDFGEFLFLRLMGGAVPEVFDFVGVGFQIEELAVGVVDEVDEFPSLAPHHRHECRAGEDAVAGVFGEDVLPRRPRFAFECGQQRFRFHRGWRSETGQLQNRRADVHLLAESVDAFPRREAVRRPHDEWHFHDRVVHRPLLTVPVIGQTVAMIGRENHHRVFQIPFRIQGIHDLPDLLVNEFHIRQIIRPLTVSVFARRVELMHDGIVIDFRIVLPQFLERRRLPREFLLGDVHQR